MDDAEEAFRAGLRGVDTLSSPAALLDPAQLASRAGRRRPSSTARAAGALLVAAAVAVAALAVWTGQGRTSVPAVPLPASTPTATAAVMGDWERISASPLSPRWGAAGAWVEGRFLVVGGRDGLPCPPNADCIDAWKRLTDGALYDPAADSWTPIAPVPSAMGVDPQAVVLGSSVYLFEGWVGKEPRHLLRYDVEANTWRTYRLPEPAGGALLATDRAIIVLAGSDEAGVIPDRLFTPANSSWSALPADPLGPSFDREAIWLGDQLLLTGHRLVANPGAEKPSLMRLAVLDETLTTWRKLPDSPILGGGGGQYVSGRVIWPSTGSADGGKVGDWGRFYPFGGIFNPATGAWDELPKATRDGGLGGYPVATEGLVGVGGNLLDPVNRTWTPVPSLPDGERTAATLVGGPGSVLLWGGSNGRVSYADGYLLRV